MKDHFDAVMEKFLIPISDLTLPISDSTYFLRRDKSFVFAEGYCHPPGALWGMIIKYPRPDGHIDVFGRPYSWTHREYVNGELTIVPFDRQVENQFKAAPELRKIQGRKPPFAVNFVKFPLDGFPGYFDNRNSLRILRREHEWIDRAVKETCALLEVDHRTVGVTGSLSYGRVEDDIDIVFFGAPQENAAIAERIRIFKRGHPEAKVVELGKEWPLRFYYAGTLICPFFKYDSPESIPLPECEMKVLEENLSFRAIVDDDLHSYYLPAIVTLAEVEQEGTRMREDLPLIVYDGSMRGELRKGDRVSLNADLVSVTTPLWKKRTALLITRWGQIRK